MKSLILKSASSKKPTNVYVNEHLTQKRSTLLYQLRIIKKNNPFISAAYTRNRIIYYKLHSRATKFNKHHIVNEDSDSDLIKSGSSDSSLNANSSTNKTIEQPTTASNK